MRSKFIISVFLLALFFLLPVDLFSVKPFPPIVSTHSKNEMLAKDFGEFANLQRQGREFFLGKNRAHSFPLITGDGFRMFADLIVEEEGDQATFDWHSVGECTRAGSNLSLTDLQAVVLFIKGDFLQKFFSSGCFEKTSSLFVIVTHNTDFDCPGNEFAHILDHPRVLAWFAQNCDRHHKKLFCIPIGLENRMWGLPNVRGSWESTRTRFRHDFVSSANRLT